MLFRVFSDEVKHSDIKVLRGPVRRPHNDLIFQVGKKSPYAECNFVLIFDIFHDPVYQF